VPRSKTIADVSLVSLFSEEDLHIIAGCKFDGNMAEQAVPVVPGSASAGGLLL